MIESKGKKIFIFIFAIIGIPILLTLSQIIGALLALLANNIMHMNVKSEFTRNVDLLIALIGPISAVIALYYLFKINKSSMIMKNSLKTKFTFPQFIEILFLAIGISAIITGIQNFNVPVVYEKPKITLNLILSSILSASIIIPIVEEFLFRGALFEVLRKRINNIHIAILIQAVIFGGIHFFNSAPNIIPWFQAIYATITGIISAYLLIKTKSFYACIAEHILSNLFGTFIIPLIAISTYFNAYVYLLIGILLTILSQFNKILKFINNLN